MHLFHCPELAPHTVELPDEEAHHALHVLRLNVGDRIGLLDGRGTRAEAVISSATKRLCAAAVVQRSSIPAERTARIHLAVAPTKQADRIEWLMEKAVELGIDRFTPLITARTERQRLRTDRLLRVAIAAMKQSQRAWLPVIDEPVTLHELMRQPLPPQRLFGWCEGRPDSLMRTYQPGADSVALIGPEGDFTADEAQRLVAEGFTPVALGEGRLRTETAALAAVAWMSLTQQR